MYFGENELFYKITPTNENMQKSCLFLKEKQFQYIFEKVPNTQSHSSSAYKPKTKLKNRNPQILGVEYSQNLWIPKLHKNGNKQ